METKRHERRWKVWDCSYPTYEEWKQGRSTSVQVLFVCSYPTYEEWKQTTLRTLYRTERSSYPTYEEWKLYTLSSSSCSANTVLILPMRNGNTITPAS